MILVMPRGTASAPCAVARNYRYQPLTHAALLLCEGFCWHGGDTKPKPKPPW